MTYFGMRKPISYVKPAKNMYEMIRFMNLGSLSGLPCIPDFYMRFLLGYIIQISRSMAHAHRSNLVHGNFNLSKVLVQRKLMDDDIMLKMS